MKKRRFPRILLILLVIAAAVFFWDRAGLPGVSGEKTGGIRTVLSGARSLLEQEPGEVRELRKRQVAQTDPGHQEYYFGLLDEEEKRVYREMLEGVRSREKEFYLTASREETADKVYHALLKDHPELFWIQNREPVYKTTYPGKDYCRFSPGYTYTDQEIQEIEAAMEKAYQEVAARCAQLSDPYEKVKQVYTYLIDQTDYVESEHDQNIAGTFWKKQAVCAGYARAVQYLLERLEIPCIYVEGDAADSTQGHAWNIVQLDGQYYYVDATNGDQPQFLEGDAAQLAEHKTTIYDYLCPFPAEYEQMYTASEEFAVPSCTATDKNFYVLNQGCFDTYDNQQLYEYCKMRLDNGAAVVRFKFSDRTAYEAACSEWITNGGAGQAAEYYMQLYGMESVEYHYGVLDNMMTVYLMF